MLNKHIVGLGRYSYPEFFKATSILQRIQERILNGIWKSQISHFLSSVLFGEKFEHQPWPVTRERLARWLLRKGVWLLKEIHMRSVFFFLQDIFTPTHDVILWLWKEVPRSAPKSSCWGWHRRKRKNPETQVERVLKVFYLRLLWDVRLQ